MLFEQTLRSRVPPPTWLFRRERSLEGAVLDGIRALLDRAAVRDAPPDPFDYTEAYLFLTKAMLAVENDQGTMALSFLESLAQLAAKENPDRGVQPDRLLCYFLGAALAENLGVPETAGFLAKASRYPSAVKLESPAGNNNYFLSKVLSEIIPEAADPPRWSLKDCARRWRLDNAFWIDYPRSGRTAEGRFLAPLSYQGRFATALTLGAAFGLSQCRTWLRDLLNAVRKLILPDGTIGWHGRSNEGIYGYVGLRFGAAWLISEGCSEYSDIADLLDRRLRHAFLRGARARVFPVEGKAGVSHDAYVRFTDHAAYAALHMLWIARLGGSTVLSPTPHMEHTVFDSALFPESGFFRLASSGHAIAGSIRPPMRWDPLSGPFPAALYAPHVPLIGCLDLKRSLYPPPYIGNSRNASRADAILTGPAGFLPLLRTKYGESIEWADPSNFSLEETPEGVCLKIRGELTAVRNNKIALPLRLALTALRKASGGKVPKFSPETMGLAERPVGGFQRKIVLSGSKLTWDDEWSTPGLPVSGHGMTLRVDRTSSEPGKILHTSEGDCKLICRLPTEDRESGKVHTSCKNELWKTEWVK